MEEEKPEMQEEQEQVTQSPLEELNSWFEAKNDAEKPETLETQKQELEWLAQQWEPSTLKVLIEGFALEEGDEVPEPLR